MEPDVYLLRYDEIGLKSDWVRKNFEHKLMDNIRAAFSESDSEVAVKRGYGRIFVETDAHELAEEVLSKTFGLVSFSPTVVIDSEMDKIVEKSGEIVDQYIDSGDSFSVRARRVGDHEYSSKDIEREVGSKVIDVTGASVDLDNPDKKLYIEVRQNRCYIFKEKISAPGGLPVGTQGKIVTLYNGDLNSFLATWMMMKRGCEVIPLYADVGPYVNQKQEDKLKEGLSILQSYSKSNENALFKFNFGQQYFNIIESTDKKIAYLIFKRILYRVANEIARREGAKAVVTGETGSKSHESFHNMKLLDNVVDIPSLRPLIGFDKNEIRDKVESLDGEELLEEVECQAYPKEIDDFDEEIIEEYEEDVDISEIVDDIISEVYGSQ